MDVDMNVGDDEEENEYDADFDAGVEADEENDPKKFIQQLTGKLSQSLRKYNESRPEADADLNKYVVGMVVKQAIEGIPEKDRNEILKKVENDEKKADGHSLDDIDNDNDEPESGGEEQNANMEDTVGESIKRERMINELFQDIVKKEDVKSDKKPLRKGNGGYRSRPY